MSGTEILPAYICERARDKYTGIRKARVRCPHCGVRHWTGQPEIGVCPRTGIQYRIAFLPRDDHPREGAR